MITSVCGSDSGPWDLYVWLGLRDKCLPAYTSAYFINAGNGNRAAEGVAGQLWLPHGQESAGGQADRCGDCPPGREQHSLSEGQECHSMCMGSMLYAI